MSAAGRRRIFLKTISTKCNFFCVYFVYIEKVRNRRNSALDFGSIPFIIWFLPVFVLIYYLIPSAQGKKAAIIVGSIFFYGVSCLSWLPYLLGLTVCAVAAAYWVRKKGKPALIISVLAFTAFLIWNKASDQLPFWRCL